MTSLSKFLRSFVYKYLQMSTFVTKKCIEWADVHKQPLKFPNLLNQKYSVFVWLHICDVNGMGVRVVGLSLRAFPLRKGGDAGLRVFYVSVYVKNSRM